MLQMCKIQTKIDKKIAMIRCKNSTKKGYPYVQVLFDFHGGNDLPNSKIYTIRER